MAEHPFKKLIRDITNTDPDVEGIIAGAKLNSLNEETYEGKELEPFAGRLLAELYQEHNPHSKTRFLAQLLKDLGA